MEKMEKKLTDKDREDIKTYLDGLGPRLTPQMRASFTTVCETFALNPFLREVYGNMVQDWQGKDQLTIIVGYEVYLKRAERTTLLDGWEKGCEGSVKGGDLKAWIKVYRKDWGRPFSHEVYYEEYVQMTKTGKPNHIWANKPRTMIQKVAIAQAFRMAFPEHFGGMPYTSDELPDNLTKNDKPVEIPQTTKPVEATQEIKPIDEPKDAPKTDLVSKVDPAEVKKKLEEFGKETFSKFMSAKKWLKEGQTIEDLTSDQLITLENNWQTMVNYFLEWKKKQPATQPKQKSDEELEEERLKNLLGDPSEGV